MSQLVEYTNNHPLLVATTVFAALALLFYELRQKGQSIAALGAADAVRLINGGAAVLDLRDANAYAAGHIVDARHLPAAELTGESLGKLKTKKGVLLVCDTGAESGRRVLSLRKDGIDNVFSLRGGLNAWRQENLPLVTSDG